MLVSAPDLVGRLAEHAPAALVYLDADLRVRFANRHCEALLGHAPAVLIGQRLHDLVDARTLHYARSHVAELERGNILPREYVLRDKAGAKRFVRVHAVPDRDRRGRSVGYFLCTSDTAAEREAQAALSEANERLALALELSQSACWAWSLCDGRVLYSAAFCALLGYEAPLPPRFAFFDAVHPEDRDAAQEALADAIAGGERLDQEFRMRDAGGEYRWFRAVGRVLRDERRGVPERFEGTLRDVSGRKRAELDLADARAVVRATVDECIELSAEVDEYRRLERVRAKLVATTNHELRTPLAAIVAALEMLRERPDGEPHEVQTLLSLALRNAERLARVVELWADVERIDLGVSRLQREPTDLSQVAAQAVADYTSRHGAALVRVQPAPQAGIVQCDRRRLRRLVEHLVAAAVDRAGGSAPVRVTSAPAEGGGFALRIELDGPDAFSCADPGLAISRAILDRLGASLQVGAGLGATWLEVRFTEGGDDAG
jgi:PAS domain S-box-containing protein